MTTPLLEVQSLHAGYGKTTVLNGISLALTPNERLAVIGRNGVGKTTLMRALMGLCPATAGSIRFQGQDISQMSTHQRAALGLGYRRLLRWRQRAQAVQAERRPAAGPIPGRAQPA